MKEYNTYIFDLDGTLLDTLEDLYISTNYALQMHNLPLRTLEEVRAFVGNGVRTLIERAVPDGVNEALLEKVLATFKVYYMKYGLRHTKPYPGVIEMLEYLYLHNKSMAVVSNKFYQATEDLCRHFFGKYIQIAIGERKDIRKKPAPDTIIEAMGKLGATTDSTVYVGDSDIDVKTALNSGLPCVSVLWGFRDRTFLIESGAQTFITHPSELYAWHVKK